VACGMWHVACGMWHVACGMWHVACGMWHVASSEHQDLLDGNTRRHHVAGMRFFFPPHQFIVVLVFSACALAAAQVDCCFVPFWGRLIFVWIFLHRLQLKLLFLFSFLSCSGSLFHLTTYQIVAIRLPGPTVSKSRGTILESGWAISKSVCAGRFIC